MYQKKENSFLQMKKILISIYKINIDIYIDKTQKNNGDRRNFVSCLLYISIINLYVYLFLAYFLSIIFITYFSPIPEKKREKKRSPLSGIHPYYNLNENVCQGGSQKPYIYQKKEKIAGYSSGFLEESYVLFECIFIFQKKLGFFKYKAQLYIPALFQKFISIFGQLVHFFVFNKNFLPVVMVEQKTIFYSNILNFCYLTESFSFDYNNHCL